MSFSPELVIYGAAYGQADVAGKVRTLRRNQTLIVQASNSVFGDSWPGVKKSLVIVYSYEPDGSVKVAIAPEGDTISLEPPNTTVRSRRGLLDSTSLLAIADVASRSNTSSQKLVILGAAYGLGDVTAKANSLVTPDGEFNQVANNSTWSDLWPGVKKSLVVVYKYSGVVLQDIVIENQTMHFIASPSLTILKAAYGLADVTKKVSQLSINAALSITANNDTFGDGWHGVDKTLVVVYQYGEEKPKVAVAKENEKLQFMYTKEPQYLGPTDPKALTILGAAYGPADVTENVQSLVTGSHLTVTASNSVFGDSWNGVKKSLVVAYHYSRNFAELKVVAEDEKLTIVPYIPPSHSALIDTNGLFQDGDILALNALNSKYVTCGADQKLVATLDAPEEGCTLTIKKPESSTSFKILSDNGKYVAVRSDKALYADADINGATDFLVSISRKGGLRFSTAAGVYIRLDSNDNLIADSVDYIGANTIFDIALKQTESRQKELMRCDMAVSLSECDLAYANLIWKLSAGFFLAIGLGPFVSVGKVQTGVLGLIQSNPRAWEAVQKLANLLITGANNNIKPVITASLGVIGVLYMEGLLWQLFKIMLNFGSWYAVGWALAKIIEIVFIPEAEAAELLASFTVWAVLTVRAGLDVGQACN